MKTMRRMEIEPAENGGFTVTHHYKPMQKTGRHGMQESYVEPESHVFGAGQGRQMMSHVMSNLGMKASSAMVEP